jgi:tungstate transport system permease protein
VPTTADLILRTLRIGFESAALAALLGVPLGVLLGLGGFRGRGPLLATFNAALRLPPVALGHLLWLLLWPDSQWGGGPLGGLRWLYTLDAVILAQTLLALPVIVALTSAAVQAVPDVLLAQARAYGAGRVAVARLALREARVGVLAALIAAVGTAMASVGAVLVVGSQDTSSTLPAEALHAWNRGDSTDQAVAYGAAMLVLFLIVAMALTAIQHGGRPRWLPVRS